jgi:PAS domain S-box-containing protein
VQNSSDIVTVLDRKGAISYTSESTHRMLGFNSEELIGKPLEDLIIEEEKSGFHQFISEVMEHPHETRTFEYTLRNASGKSMVLQSVFNNLLDVEEIQGVVVNSRDITQKKEAETELKKTNFELDSFVYRASHDLRAPLRSVLGLLNLIKIEPEDKTRSSYLSLAEKSINKLDSFILDLTNFSRNTRLEIKKEKIDFHALIAECIDNLKYMENAGRVKPIIEIKESEPFLSDPGRMAILFQNLISNAIKYQKLYVDSFVKISIEVRESGAYIQVADNGKGISAEYLDKIFEMFFRASEDSYGSGLGLYITRQVVEKLQGKIEVESVFSEGTTFKVWLPHPVKKQEELHAAPEQH